MRSTVAIAFWLLTTAGCAKGSPIDAGFDAARDRPDAQSIFRDAGPAVDDAGADDGGVDAGAPEDAGGMDAGGMDAGGTDAGGTDAGGPDAGPMGVDAGTGETCPSLNMGHTPTLDGSGDLAEFGAAQLITADGPVGSADTYGITWDRDYLYIALSSPVFADGLRPLHIYVEARATLSAAAPTAGKEYDGLTAELPFSATHLIAVRRSTGSPPYNGIYGPGGGWTTRLMGLVDGTDVFSEGTDMVSVRVPWSTLGCANAIRLTAHVVNGPIAGNEWKDFIPSTTTPWMAPGGGYHEIDLTADPAVTGWTLR